MAPVPPLEPSPNEPHPPPPHHHHHVAALAFPFATHAGPLLAILHRLATAAPNTLFSFFSTSQSNNSLFSNTNSSEIPSNIKVCDVADGVPQGYVFVGKPQEDIELFLNAAPRNFRSSLDASVAETGRQVTCLITDAFLWFGAHLADDLGVPWVPVWLSGINSLSAHLHTDLIRHTITIATQSIAGHENELISSWIKVNTPGLSKVRIKDLPEGVIFGNLNSVFSRMLHQMAQLLPRATALVINTFDELDPANHLFRSKFNKLLNVGPFNLLAAPSPPQPTPTGSTSAECLSWLDKQPSSVSVVYVSFGSVAKPPEEELTAIAEALEASRVPFIWSLKESFKTPLLSDFLTSRLTKLNGLVVPWAPQPQVLAHASVGAFVTHCGWSSLLETIAGGVPMICRPFFGDQRLNARMVADVLEIGVIVEDGVFTKNGVMQSLNQVLSQERGGNKYRENVNAVKQLAQQAVGPQGSSTQNFKLLLDVISATNNKV